MSDIKFFFYIFGIKFENNTYTHILLFWLLLNRIYLITKRALGKNKPFSYKKRREYTGYRKNTSVKLIPLRSEFSTRKKRISRTSYLTIERKWKVYKISTIALEPCVLAMRRPSFPLLPKERLIKCADAACQSFQIASRVCRFEKAARLRHQQSLVHIHFPKVKIRNHLFIQYLSKKKKKVKRYLTIIDTIIRA